MLYADDSGHAVPDIGTVKVLVLFLKHSGLTGIAVHHRGKGGLKAGKVWTAFWIKDIITENTIKPDIQSLKLINYRIQYIFLILLGGIDYLYNNNIQLDFNITYNSKVLSEKYLPIYGGNSKFSLNQIYKSYQEKYNLF